MKELARPFYFVPVPLHPSRFRERGYNQAERIAMALAFRLGGRVCRWLSRSSFRVSQTKLSRGEREWNVAGAFMSRLPPRLPATGTVFVVDDVYTTGATTASCVAAFGRSFPLDVKVCTLLYDEPASAVMDFAADCRMEWDGNWVGLGKKNAPDGGAL
jgi:predicted amidophosphoribosyltransferase